MADPALCERPILLLNTAVNIFFEAIQHWLTPNRAIFGPIAALERFLWLPCVTWAAFRAQRCNQMWRYGSSDG